MSRPTDRAFAQASAEQVAKNGNFIHYPSALRRAREIDAATPEGAQGAVAKVVFNQPNNYSQGHRIKWLTQVVLPVGTKLYTHPPADAEDAARYRRIAALYNGMKSSTSERFLSCLGIDFFDEQAHLERTLDELLSAIDAARDGEGA